MVENYEIEQLQDFNLANIMARPRVAAASIGEALGGSASLGPRVSNIDGGQLMGIGPGVWLAYAEKADLRWEARLRQRLDGLASVSDQSSAYSLFRVCGMGARMFLQRGLPIDLDEKSFGPGSAAMSIIAHMGVLLWKPSAIPLYHVACFRSHETSFRHWLDFSSLAGATK